MEEKHFPIHITVLTRDHHTINLFPKLKKPVQGKCNVIGQINKHGVVMGIQGLPKHWATVISPPSSTWCLQRTPEQTFLDFFDQFELSKTGLLGHLFLMYFTCFVQIWLYFD